VRPYLIQDGGNVQVVSISDGTIALRLEGACASCPSSTITMKQGIENALRTAFRAQLKEVTQVQFSAPATLEAVNEHLSLFKPALHRFGGDINCVAALDGTATVIYEGPDVMFTGICQALKDRFPGQIQHVERVSPSVITEAG